MMNALNILQKVLVNHFYKVNTGFFLISFFLLFGIPQNVLQFHLSIITIIIQSHGMLGAAMVIWVLYNIKCMDYVIKHLRQPRQQFLYCLHNLPWVQVYMYLLLVQVLVYMPVLAYVSFAAALAIKTQYIFSFIKMVSFTAAMLGLPPIAFVKVRQ